MGVLGALFSYPTIKVVRIENWRLGLLFRLLQLAILLYIAVVAIYMKGGYQATEELIGNVSLKVKGTAYTSEPITAAGRRQEGQAAGSPSFRPGADVVFDSDDVSFVAQDSAFVATSVFLTPDQARGVWTGTEDDERCDVDGESCRARAGRQSYHGILTGNPFPCPVNETFCEYAGWGPAEIRKPRGSRLHGVQNFTVFVRVNARWPEFHVDRTNVNSSRTAPTMGYNLFTLGDIVSEAGAAWDDVVDDGAVIAAISSWGPDLGCNFDFSAEQCQVSWRFVRLDDPNGTFSHGSNRRHARYFKAAAGDPERRDLFKFWGIQILATTSGRGRRFSFIPLLLNIGSGVGLLAMATIVADFCALYIFRRKEIYQKEKFQQVFDEQDGAAPPSIVSPLLAK